MDEYYLPNPLFCFQFSQKNLTEHHRLTGEYLDEITSDLNYKEIFKKIVYNNKTHWNTLKMRKLNSTIRSKFYSSDEIELNHLYYSTMKCFEIDLKIIYENDDFSFLDDKFILKIHLNKKFRKSSRQVFFHYRQMSSVQKLGAGFLYNIGKIGKRHSKEPSFHNYELEFRQFDTKIKDNFEILKNPIKLFGKQVNENDISGYFNRMKEKFKDDFNLTTGDLLLDNDLMKIEIDNDLFEQFYLQIQNVSDHSSLTSFSYKITGYHLFSKHYDGYTKEPDFSFSFSFLSRQVEMTNEENYTKLLITILNALSLWLHISILDIYIYLFKIGKLFIGFRLLLGDVQHCLKTKLDYNPQDFPDENSLKISI